MPGMALTTYLATARVSAAVSSSNIAWRGFDASSLTCASKKSESLEGSGFLLLISSRVLLLTPGLGGSGGLGWWRQAAGFALLHLLSQLPTLQNPRICVAGAMKVQASLYALVDLVDATPCFQVRAQAFQGWAFGGHLSELINHALGLQFLDFQSLAPP